MANRGFQKIEAPSPLIFKANKNSNSNSNSFDDDKKDLKSE